MLQSKLRVTSVLAAILFVLVAGYTSISFLRTEAQEPAKPDGQGSKLKQL